jgi:hypothetical protein
MAGPGLKRPEAATRSSCIDGRDIRALPNLIVFNRMKYKTPLLSGKTRNR